jgi:methyl-accepting chemotaxis protein
METLVMADRRFAPLAWYNDRRIRTKMLTSVLVLMLGAFTIVGLAIPGLNQAAAEAEVARSQGVKALVALGRVHQQEIKDRLLIANYALADGPEGRAAVLADIRESDAELDTWAATYNEAEAKDEGNGQDAWDEFETAWASFRQVRDTVLIPLADRGDVAGFVKAHAAQAKPVISVAADALDREELSREKIADQAVARAVAKVADTKRLIIVAALVGAAMGGALALLMVRTITAGLAEVGRVIGALANGDLTQRTAVHARDDIGVMSASLNDSLDAIVDVVKVLDGTAGSLASAAEEMSAVTTEMASSAQSQSQQSADSAAAAEQVSANVQTVAAATEEMSASVGEIAHSANEAARVGQSAVTLTSSSAQIVTSLGESSTQIGSVVATIEAIAEQTNMLALNATIEAARAGEHGRGFEVVAREVKDLARETAKATQEIQGRVASIQEDAAAAVSVISQVDGVVAQINDYQMTIASAVEEQTATTNEMSRNISDAATGTAGIAQNVAASASAQADNAAGVSQVRAAASEVAQMSATLRAAVDRFTI